MSRYRLPTTNARHEAEDDHHEHSIRTPHPGGGWPTHRARSRRQRRRVAAHRRVVRLERRAARRRRTKGVAA